MIKIPTNISDLYVLEPRIFNDDRGYFFESYNKNTLSKLDLQYNFVQDNESFSERGVFRGFHFQLGNFAQAKLVRACFGSIVDIAIDLRPDSETFGESFAVELSQENNKQLIIPRGFAHGFLVTSEYAKVLYKADNFYNPSSECGFNLSSYLSKLHLPNIGEIKINDKDKNYQGFNEIVQQIKSKNILVV
jgi:dTDP-4-dehydrorhamnose 3,5-epimerase